MNLQRREMRRPQARPYVPVHSEELSVLLRRQERRNACLAGSNWETTTAGNVAMTCAMTGCSW